MKTTIFLSLLASFFWIYPNLSDDNSKTYSLQEALEKKLVEIKDLSSQGGTSKIKLSLSNLQKKQDLRIEIPSGTQLASQDTSEQDVIIVEFKTLLVKAQSSVNTTLKGYCTQANNRSPGEGSKFALKDKADGRLMQLAEYLRNNKDVDEYLYQHAVWVITDDHDLRGLHHDNPEKAIAMHKFIADLTGKPMPTYTVRYDDGRVGEVAFTGIIVMIYGDFEYDLEKDCAMTLEVYNEGGEMVQSVFKDMAQRRGHSRSRFKLKARDLPQGKYTSKLFKDGELFMQMEVEV